MDKSAKRVLYMYVPPRQPTVASREPGKRTRWRSWSVRVARLSALLRRAFGARPSAGVGDVVTDETRPNWGAVLRDALPRANH